MWGTMTLQAQFQKNICSCKSVLPQWACLRRMSWKSLWTAPETIWWFLGQLTKVGLYVHCVGPGLTLLLTFVATLLLWDTITIAVCCYSQRWRVFLQESVGCPCCVPWSCQESMWAHKAWWRDVWGEWPYLIWSMPVIDVHSWHQP